MAGMRGSGTPRRRPAERAGIWFPALWRSEQEHPGGDPEDFCESAGGLRVDSAFIVLHLRKAADGAAHAGRQAVLRQSVTAAQAAHNGAWCAGGNTTSAGTSPSSSCRGQWPMVAVGAGTRREEGMPLMKGHGAAASVPQAQAGAAKAHGPPGEALILCACASTGLFHGCQHRRPSLFSGLVILRNFPGLRAFSGVRAFGALDNLLPEGNIGRPAATLQMAMMGPVVPWSLP